MNHYIDVILPLPIPTRFTYQVLEEDAVVLQVGMRVAVPFGKTKVYTGIVAHMHHEAPKVYQAKLIEQLLDEQPVVTPIQLKFWKWISSYYMCTEGDVLKAALPSAFLLESETVVELNTKTTIDEANLTDEEYLVYEALQRQSVIKIKEISQLLGKKNVLNLLQKLVAKEVIIVSQELYKQYKPKLIRYIKLANTYDEEKELQSLLESLNRAPKQSSVVLTLFSLRAKSKKPISVKELTKESGASAAIIKTLVDKAILEEYYLQQDRTDQQQEIEKFQLDLNEHQQQAYAEINEHFEEKKVTLLHGITSSGKTEIYIQLIKDTIAKGKQTLYLLPEIALTTQLISRLQKYFGDDVLVFHSKYSLNERVEVYKHVLEGSKGKIVIGARSSIFLPFQQLGLIIVDESHETTFKQYDPAPRYQARDASVVLANFTQANLLLGSATPSLESYFNAQHHKYGLVTLNRRYGNVLPPQIELVDIKDKHKRKLMKGHFSDTLLGEMKKTLSEGKQIILFQNRRGFSPILECNICGNSPQCPNCDVSLTYHKHNNSLRCHYCGYHMAMQLQCMACKSTEISTKGFGTEQIETELKSLFPDNKIGRMDLDTTRGKHGYEKIITAFEQQEIDVLIGTQMLSKGLDFRNVDLVGVMNADSLLNFPDFRAHERSFHMLVQVAGRAGRTQQRGKVLIQAYNPNHQILQQVTTHSYVEMYKEQLQERHNFKYPPIYRLIKLTFKGRDFNGVNEASSWFAKGLAQGLKENVLGPEFPPVARIRNEYYKNIIIKIPPEHSISKTKGFIEKVKKTYDSIGSFKKIRVIINVDPY
ncbi:primosomal protein N' [Mesonia sp. MT50]|uniref:Replication restart protein PriA n=2 Tax=Mesonia TaxID=232115 RepID=A0ABU1A692_9FLAO|nr:primosomal protein N' [Mesonia profundi]MDQ7918628.1 primosomal protein N' [Mesonia profundi]